MWESFGRLEQVKHADLWQRLRPGGVDPRSPLRPPMRQAFDHEDSQPREFIAG